MRDGIGGSTHRIGANQFALIRSFLIDSGRPRPLHVVICAKLFHRVDAFVANTIHAKCDAYNAEILPKNYACSEIPPSQKPLFHRAFLNVCVLRAHRRRMSRTRAIDSNFLCVIASQRVARRAHTRFVTR
jgi:hypothetical protein